MQDQYKPPAGRRTGNFDEVLKTMWALLSVTNDPRARREIQAEIEKCLAAQKPKMAINVAALPESLRHLVKAPCGNPAAPEQIQNLTSARGDLPISISRYLTDLRSDYDKWASNNQGSLVPEYVWNTDLNDFIGPERTSSIEWIVVGNNPGTVERGPEEDRPTKGPWLGRYFHPRGQTGSWTRIILGNVVTDLQREVLFLEKSPMFSKNSEWLKRFANLPAFSGTQHRMAEAVFDLHRLTGAQVWIQGAGATYSHFMEKLRILYQAPSAQQCDKLLWDSVYITDHLERIIRKGQGFPVEGLFTEGLAAALAQLRTIQ